MWDDKPSMITKSIALGVAFVRHAADLFRHVSTEEKQRRLEICQGCEHLRDNGTCGKCGCLLSVKAAWSSEKCPLEKW